MRKNLLLFLSFLFQACTNSNSKNQVEIFNEIEFNLLNKERVQAIQPDIKEIYFSYLSDRSFQVPLYKYIQEDNYRIFLGIPYNTTLEEILISIDKPTPKDIEFSTDSSNFIYKKYHDSTAFITEYTVTCNSNLLYILAVTENALLSDSLFSKEQLSKRLDNCKN